MMKEEFTFGIYPLSAAGTPFGVAAGPEDDYHKIRFTLNDLRGDNRLLTPRVYLIYTPEWEEKMFSLGDRYLEAGLIADLVVGVGDWTQSEQLSLEMDRWLGFIRKVIVRYGASLSSLQITNEPNLSFMEGSKPYIVQALAEGVMAAKKEIRNRNLSIEVGFGSVPDGPAAVSQFWSELAELGGDAFIRSVDFVGHNFYVDVFEDKPLDLKEIPVVTEQLLRSLRENNLKTAGIPASVAIRITENGWPTGKNPIANVERSYERQSEVLELVIRTIHGLRGELNITKYVLFGLRDADSSKEDLFHQYGILRDDYTPKPAYETFQKLVAELGASVSAG